MLKAFLQEEISKIVGRDVEFKISEPERAENGDFSTNVAFKVGNAEDIAEKLRRNELVKEVIVKNKFINIFLKDEVLLKSLGDKIKFLKKKEKINVEFVSANPTGPLTMANARGGFYGDALANVLKLFYNEVVREYFVNDAGNQVKLLGESVLAELSYIPKKPEHYKGEYIKNYAKFVQSRLDEIHKLRYDAASVQGILGEFDNEGKFKISTFTQNIEHIGKRATEKIDIAELSKKEIEESLIKAGIKFDVWFSEEKNLRQKGELKKVLELLNTRGVIRENAGALWLDDNVLIKSNQEPTYFLSDLAYHYDKLLKRKFDVAIDVWGADHHGYVARMQRGVVMLGVNPERLKIIIMQLVRLVRGGKEVVMSKRTGEFVTLDELLDEVGLDATRWFFISHAPETHMDFDLDLAKERSEKNPVYYVQYAHTRMHSILAKSKIKNQKSKLINISHPAERNLIMKILRYPELLEDISKDYQVHRLTTYAYELAQTFSAFYRDVKVLGSAREAELLYLVLKTKETLADLLKLLGISAPEKM